MSAAVTLGVAAASWAAPAGKAGPPSAVSGAGGTQRTSAHFHHGHDDDAGSTPESRAALRNLIAEGESKLSRGDVDGARAAFDQASLMAHSADIELGVLRCQMQAGQYRQALAFAAHTAGVHLDDADGAVFYAWLLNLGSHVAVAEQTLLQVEARDPAHASLRDVRQRFQSGALMPEGELLNPPGRLAPYATGVAVPESARAVATGLLLADGEHALVPRAALYPPGSSGGHVRIWVRNGLGQTVHGHPEHATRRSASAASVASAASTASSTPDHQDDADASPLVMLHLSAKLPVAGGDVVAPRDAFPGSPMFALDYPANAGAQAAWPLMRAGFLGMPQSGATPGLQKLGLTLPGSADSPRGGPVYDQGGRLIGVTQGASQLVPMSALRAAFGERFGAVSPAPRPDMVGADEIYERAMKTTLQVITSRP